MTRSISIIGASGAVGTALAAQILRTSLLNPGDRLQLVGRGTASGSARLLSIRIDLMDAFDDNGIDVEVVANTEDVDGDIVVMCAGVSLQGNLIDRREWGKANLVVYEEIAAICAERVPDSLFIIVSNPVELAVKIFSEKLGRERVIGMGAEQDSLRFARAIAHDLGISRQGVLASVLGEHGQAMVPLWTSCTLTDQDERMHEAFERMREQSATVPLEDRVSSLRSQVVELLQQEEVNEAYEATRRALPDARIFIQPLITWRTMHSTPNATANATLRFLAAATSDTRHSLHGQVSLLGDFLNIRGVCGVPVELNRHGWKISDLPKFSKTEESRVVDAADAIQRYLWSLQ